MHSQEFLSQVADVTAGTEPVPLHLARLFEATVRRFENRVAVKHGKESVTYRDLDARAGLLARALIDRGVRPATFVGVSIERGIDLIVAILGILKAGAAYVPLDPAYPAKRVELILSDAGLKILVSTSATTLPAISRTERIDLDSQRLIASQSLPTMQHSPDDPAYVIYTSGSTGRPKGVVISHFNAVRLFSSTRRWFGFDEHDVWTLFHSVGFDFSVWEIWGALLFGGTLIVVPLDVARSAERFRKLLVEQAVTVLNQTPTAFRNLIRVEQAAPERNPHLRHVIFGGEKLDPQWLRPWFERYGDERPQMHNMYGTTETTVHATWKRLRAGDLDRAGSPIGVPITDLRIHVLDDHSKPVADGEVGELCIEGPGVSRGYLNQPGLTAERFVEYVSEGQARRVYRTGDLVRRERDGELHYAGRSDEQLKVRGFRIEPREIELCLRRQAGISAVTVAAHDCGSGDVRLIAYVVPKGKTAGDGDSMRRTLSQAAAEELPAYMRPSHYVFLESLPLTEHGKIDRGALARVGSHSSAAEDHSQRKSESIAKIWERVLRRTGIGDADDFFEIGGTSLALVRVLAEIESGYGIRIDPAALADGITMGRMNALVAQQARL